MKNLIFDLIAKHVIQTQQAASSNLVERQLFLKWISWRFCFGGFRQSARLVNLRTASTKRLHSFL